MSSVLQSEVRRIARLEVNSALKQFAAECEAVRKAVKQLEAKLGKPVAAVDVVSQAVAAGSSMRFASDTLLALRSKLAVSQREMAALVGVSAQAVYLWERKKGALRLRNDTRRALLRLRSAGKRGVHQMLVAKGIR